MELNKLYDSISNPIADKSILEKLVIDYSLQSKKLGGFYSELIKNSVKNYHNGQYRIADADKFYATLFNKWKNSIVNMTKEEYVEAFKRGKYGNDLVELRNFLLKVPDVKTEKEANEIFYGDKYDETLANAMDKYRWSAFGEYSGWDHVCSRYLTAKKDTFPKIEHRLYLNTESVHTYELMNEMISKFDQYQLPYYFKFSRYADRDDTIVCYCSTEDLTKYINILLEIKAENPELIANMKKPPILTGLIDGWIGYGSEPTKKANGKNQSFNGLRARVIEPVIDQITKRWVYLNKDTVYNYNGNRIPFKDILANKCAYQFVEKLKKRFAYEENEKIKQAKNEKRPCDLSSIQERLGVTKQDLDNPEFLNNIYNVVKERIVSRLAIMVNGDVKSVNPIIMAARYGKRVEITGYDIGNVIEDLAPQIIKNDPNYLTSIQMGIKNQVVKHGIDPNNICFDIDAIKKISMEVNKQNSEPDVDSYSPGV